MSIEMWIKIVLSGIESFKTLEKFHEVTFFELMSIKVNHVIELNEEYNFSEKGDFLTILSQLIELFCNEMN